jgi:cell division protein FtsB
MDYRFVPVGVDSQKGGACLHTEACIVSHSDEHNDRVGKLTNSNIRLSLTTNNYVWKDPTTPDLQVLDRRIRQDYEQEERVCRKAGKECRYHRKMPSSGKTAASPIKESILLLPSNGIETNAMVKEVVGEIEKRMGWRCIRIYIHRDEIFVDPDTDEEHSNPHAHIVWDTYCWEKHVCHKATKTDLRFFQKIATKVTRMPIGIPTEKTKARHKNPHLYKVEQERKRAQVLTEKNEALQKKNEKLEYQNMSLQEANNRLNDDNQLRTKKLEKTKKEEYLFWKEYGIRLGEQFIRLAQHVQPTEEEQSVYKTLSERCSQDYYNNGEIGDIYDYVLKMHEIILSLINRFMAALTRAQRSTAVKMWNNKFLSRFLTQDQMEDLRTVDELREKLEEAENRARAAEERRALVFSLAAKSGLTVDECALQEQIMSLMSRIPNKRHLPPLYPQHLLKGEIISIRAGGLGLSYQVRWNYRMQSLEFRVDDVDTKMRVGWSPDIRTAEEKHSAEIQRQYALDSPLVTNKKLYRHR